MKNILVVGPPRIGKTTLSKMIVKQIPAFSVINVDVIRESIYKSICVDMEKKERKKLVKDAFPLFIKTMLKQYTSYYNPELFYVIEGDLLSVEAAIEVKKEYDVDVVCVGTPNISVDDLFNRIRKNAFVHGCWTDKFDDEQLYKLCREIIEQSKEELMISRENDLIYIDNSFNIDCLQNYVDSVKSDKKYRSKL